MKLRPNPFYLFIRRAFKIHPSWQNPWSGIVFRSVPLQFGKPEQIVDGMGAVKSGGRWNPPGTIRTLYCSLSAGTAAEESLRLFETVGLHRRSVKPRLIVGIRYRLHAVIDLPSVMEAISGPELAALMTEPWQQSNAHGRETKGQALGRALFSLKVEGFLVPSARLPDTLNLVVFPQNLRSGSQQEVLEPGDLKRWLKQ